MGKVSLKKNISSMQVIKTLKILTQGDYSMSELIYLLNADEKDAIFNNSVISKYINTCRCCGFNIPKINNKYFVATMPFGLNISNEEKNLLIDLQLIAKNNFTSKWHKLFDKFIEKLNRYSNIQLTTIDKKNYNISFELFERAVAQKRKIKLIFKNKQELECIPLNISQSREKTLFNVYNKYIRHIDINRLSGIQFSENTFQDVYNWHQEVVFKLKDKLAKRYEARENETIQQNADGTITVTNYNEDKEYLLSRLLRYDDKCEILKPESLRTEIKNILNDMLKNYGEY